MGVIFQRTSVFNQHFWSRYITLPKKNPNNFGSIFNSGQNSSLQQYIIESREAHRGGREKNPKPILK